MTSKTSPSRLSSARPLPRKFRRALIGTTLASAVSAVCAAPGTVNVDGTNWARTYYANSPSGAHAVYNSAGVLQGTLTVQVTNPTTNVSTIEARSDSGTPLRKFVDTLPGLGARKANNLGNHLPVAVASKWVTPGGTTTGDDYYELAIVEYQQKLHTDLAAPTPLRGYVQIDHKATASQDATLGVLGSGTGTPYALTYPDSSPIFVRDSAGALIPHANGVALPEDTSLNPVKYMRFFATEQPRYLGPAIVATSGVAVRLKVHNLLPAGRGMTVGNVFKRNGDLFLPVDTTLIGSGLAPDGKTLFTQNRASVHLHGGDSPWISDGTPSQWFTPVSELDASLPGTLAADYALDPAARTPIEQLMRGASAVNVPDMGDPGPGAMTFYYPNNQTPRMLWYHDHTIGLTRVNVYGGIAAPYVITSADEAAFASANNIPGPDAAIPLVIQDKTFVPKDFADQDANWDSTKWGGEGSLWFPHVYETNGWTTMQVNNEVAAAAAIRAQPGRAHPGGRWDYGPELTGISPAYPLMKGTSDQPSTTPESFMDTAMVNGVAYPAVDVEPRVYRFRVLNATNDRFLNLGLYQGFAHANAAIVAPATGYDDRTEIQNLTAQQIATIPDCDPNAPTFKVDATTGLQMNASVGDCWPTTWPPRTPSLTAPTNLVLDPALYPSQLPHPATVGPKIVQIGNETGWLPAPREIPSTPVSFAAAQNAGNKNLMGGMAPLNNVGTHGLHLSPAERADILIDFSQYAGQTLILYNDSPAPSPGADPRYDYFTDNADQSAAGGAEPTQAGLGPNTRTIMQIRVAAPGAQVPRDNLATTLASPVKTEFDKGEALLFSTTQAGQEILSATNSWPTQITDLIPNAITIEDKAIVEEFDPSHARLNALFGVVTPLFGPRALAYADKPTEVMRDGDTQVWRIVHTGVDTHPIHFHLVNVQVLARVNADGTVEAPPPEEAGWKDTVKMNPGQDTLVAFKSKRPTLNGFSVPPSIRALDPTQPTGAQYTGGFTQMDPATGQHKTMFNEIADLGWEYVWHCHILGHEENDFMRTVKFLPNETGVSVAPTVVATRDATKVNLAVTDNEVNEYGYRVTRVPVTAPTGGTPVGSPVNLTTRLLPAMTGPNPAVTNQSFNWSENWASLTPGATYRYKVSAVGSQATKTAGVLSGLAQVTKDTSVDVTLPARLQAPTLATPTSSASSLTTASVTLNWTNTSTGQSGYVVERAAGVAVPSTVISTVLPGSATSYVDTTAAAGTQYSYRVRAVDTNFPVGSASYTAGPQSGSGTITTAPWVQPPSTVTAAFTAASNTVTISWKDVSNNETAFQVVRSEDGGATWSAPLATLTRTTSQSRANTSATLVSATDKKAMPGVTYVYGVRAVKTTAPASNSSVSAAAPLAIPALAVPTTVTAALGAATATTTPITVSFRDMSPNESGFLVERSGDAGATWTQLGTVVSTAANTTATNRAVTFSDATADVDTPYSYRVSAYWTATGAAAPTYSAPVAIAAPISVPLPAVPTPIKPTFTVAGTGATRTATVTFTWTDNAVNETQFFVERSNDNGVTWVPAGTAASGGMVAQTVANIPLVGRVGTLRETVPAPAPAGTAKYLYRVTAERLVGNLGWDAGPSAATAQIAP